MKTNRYYRSFEYCVNCKGYLDVVCTYRMLLFLRTHKKNKNYTKILQLTHCSTRLLKKEEETFFFSHLFML